MTGQGTGDARGSGDAPGGPVRDGAAGGDPPGADRSVEACAHDDEPDAPAGGGSLPPLREEFRRMNERAVTGRWASKRRAKIHAELERNRNKDYKIPTWVLGLVLVVVVVGWVLLIALG